MPRVCLTCSHSARAEVDEALIRGEARASIARRFNVPPDSLDRHWTGDHIAREVRERFDSDYDALARLSDEMVACATRLVMRKRATAADVSAAARVAEVRGASGGPVGRRWPDPAPGQVGAVPVPPAPLLAELRDRGALPTVDADAAALQ